MILSKISPSEKRSNIDTDKCELFQLTKDISQTDYIEIFTDIVVRLGKASERGDSMHLIQLEKELDSLINYFSSSIHKPVSH